MQARTTDRLLLGGIGLLMVALVAVLAQSLNDRVAKEGEQAPSFSIRTDNGSTVSAENFGGRVLILNFWATWCAPCVNEIPALDVLQKRFRDRGLIVVALSVDNDANAYREFLSRNAVTFQTAREGDNRVNAAYGTFRYPETYIIDRTGRIVKKIVGEERWSDDRVMSYVESLL